MNRRGVNAPHEELLPCDRAFCAGFPLLVGMRVMYGPNVSHYLS